MSLFRILRFNVAFAEYIERLTDHSVMVAISEALEVLNSQSCYQNRDLSVGACLMISLILQWAVRHLCKALMQVMTPEGIVAFHKKIPSSYVLNYLENQAHFSLEKLIFCQNRALQNNRQALHAHVTTDSHFLLPTQAYVTYDYMCVCIAVCH